MSLKTTNPKNQKACYTALQWLAIALALLLCQGMDCSKHHDPPSLMTIHLKDIHLEIAEPATGTIGVRLAWDAPEEGKVSYYEIYQATHSDSLKYPALTVPASDSPSVVLPLPNSSRPMTLYFAIRSVWVEPTGQKLFGDSLAIDSIRVLPSLSILSPASGSTLKGRHLRIEIDINSDPGILLHRYLYEKRTSRWTLLESGCLPSNGCNSPIFGRGFQPEDLILQDIPERDTVPSLFCVLGTESFEGDRTGLIQSLSCSRYLRFSSEVTARDTGSLPGEL